MPRDYFTTDEACFLLTVTKSSTNWIVAVSKYLYSILAGVGAPSGLVVWTASWASCESPLLLYAFCWILTRFLTSVLAPVLRTSIGIFGWRPMADNVIKFFLANVNNFDVSQWLLWASSGAILLLKSLRNIRRSGNSVHITHIRYSTISTSSTKALLPSFLFCHASSNICLQAVVYASFSRLVFRFQF